ncbi:MAG: hypothetical protein QXK69_11220 [Candidatus Caldarchaeum sp.]
MKVKRLVGVLVVAVSVLMLLQLWPVVLEAFIGGVYYGSEWKAAMVEAKLTSLGAKKCGEYTAPVGRHTERVELTTSGEELRCYILIRMPQLKELGYFLNLSVVRYSVTVGKGAAYKLFVYGASTSIVGANPDQVFTNYGPAPMILGNFTNVEHMGRYDYSVTEHRILYIALKPYRPGHYRITVDIFTEIVKGSPPSGPPAPTVQGGRRPTLAERLGIKDVNELARYLGYEKCGEHRFDRAGIYNITTVIDPNTGKACYFLFYPKSETEWVKGKLRLAYMWTERLPPPIYDVLEFNGSLMVDSIQALITGNPQSDDTVNPPPAYSRKLLFRGGLNIIGIPTASLGDGFIILFSLRKPSVLPYINGTITLEIILEIDIISER